MPVNTWLWIAIIILTTLLIASIIVSVKLHQCNRQGKPCFRHAKNILQETQQVPTEFQKASHEEPIQDVFTRCERIHGVGNCKLTF